MNQEQTQQEYNDKVAQVASLAVTFAKTGNGFFSLRSSFNELCEQPGANKGIDHDSTIGRRKLLVQSVCIKCIPSLSSAENSRLEDQLKEIAEDRQEGNSRARMRR